MDNAWLPQSTAVLKEAAKSPLGAIALMIFASSSIAFYFFSQSGEYIKLGAFILLLLAFGMFTLAVSKQVPGHVTQAASSVEMKPANGNESSDKRDSVMATKPASLFWLAYDLRYTIDAVLHNFVKDSIVHHLKQTVHHAKALEINQIGDEGHGRWWEAREMSLLKPSPGEHEAVTRAMELESIEARVLRIRSEVENTNEKNVSQKQQRSWAAQLEEIAVMIGKLAAAEQSGFVPEPEGIAAR